MTKIDDGILSEIIAMAWADEVSFDAIEALHGLKEKEVKALMRSSLKSGSYKVWRTRVTGRKAKHNAQMRPKTNANSYSSETEIEE